MLSVVILTRTGPAATFLINRVQDVIPVQKVIYESWDGPPEPDTRTKVERARGTFDSYTRYYHKRIHEEVNGTRVLELAGRDKIFGHRWTEIESPTNVVEVFDRDWDAAAAELKSDPPDLILVFGTGLIPSYVTEVAKLACINIHTGLSPHYRGQNCTPFCVINEDFENIGVTVHLVRNAIDGGEILVQRRPHIEEGDDEFTINMKNQRIGAEIYCEIIEALGAGKRLNPQTQAKDVGLLLMNRALTQGHKSLVRTLVKGGAVERYLARAAKNKTRPKNIIDSLQVV